MLLGRDTPVGSTATPRLSREGAWQFPVTVACVLLGMMITVQFKTQRREDFPLYRQSEKMQRMVTSLESSNEELTRGVKYLETERNKLVADLQDTRDQLHSMEGEPGHQGDRALVQGLKSDLERARVLAGLVPVKGPGVEVELNDSPRTPGANDDPYFFLIHDLDIQAFVNELWAAGAEAVAVNDQRLATSSSVRCVGPTVLVNAVRLAPPYVIRAIGDPRTLETALRMPGGVLNNMENQLKMGLRISITRSERPLVLPEFKGAASFRYLQPAPSESPSQSPGEHSLMWMIFGLAVGVVLGLYLPFEVPMMYSKYVSATFLAGMDSVLGGARAGIERKFDTSVFYSGFITNALLAAGLTFLGDRLGVDLYLAAIVTFGVRIFQNLAYIRRDLLGRSDARTSNTTPPPAAG